MAKEVLAVPEEHLNDVVKVIRVGLYTIRNNPTPDVHPEVREQLIKWCNEMSEVAK